VRYTCPKKVVAPLGGPRWISASTSEFRISQSGKDELSPVMALASGEWVQVERPMADTSEDKDTVVLRVGVSDAALDAIGDVHNVEILEQAGSSPLPKSTLLNLHWEGFMVCISVT
jgi:hypothetical protein